MAHGDTDKENLCPSRARYRCSTPITPCGFLHLLEQLTVEEDIVEEIQETLPNSPLKPARMRPPRELCFSPQLEVVEDVIDQKALCPSYWGPGYKAELTSPLPWNHAGFIEEDIQPESPCSEITDHSHCVPFSRPTTRCTNHTESVSGLMLGPPATANRCPTPVMYSKSSGMGEWKLEHRLQKRKRARDPQALDGELYAARLSDGTRVTIRQVAYWPSLSGDMSTVARIVNTVEKLSGVRHKVLAKYHGTETADGLAVDGHHRLSIISSWAPGESVADIIRQEGRIPFCSVRLYLHQLLDGLSVLHQMEEPHRRLQASRVHCTEDGTLTMVDYSLELGWTDLGLENSYGCHRWDHPGLHQNPEFLPPEVMCGEPEGDVTVDHLRRKDIWSFGCLAYQMASGQLPWSQSAPRGGLGALFQIAQHGYGEVQNIPGVSDEFMELITSCLAHDAADRPSAEVLMTHPLVAKRPEWSVEEHKCFPKGLAARVFAFIIATKGIAQGTNDASIYARIAQGLSEAMYAPMYTSSST